MLNKQLNLQEWRDEKLAELDAMQAALAVRKNPKDKRVNPPAKRVNPPAQSKNKRNNSFLLPINPKQAVPVTVEARKQRMAETYEKKRIALAAEIERKLDEAKRKRAESPPPFSLWSKERAKALEAHKNRNSKMTFWEKREAAQRNRELFDEEQRRYSDAMQHLIR